MSHIGQQFLNCLEGLMFYCLKTRTFGEETIETIYRLFGHHKKCLNKLQVSDNLHIHTSDVLIPIKRFSGCIGDC